MRSVSGDYGVLSMNRVQDLSRWQNCRVISCQDFRLPQKSIFLGQHILEIFVFFHSISGEGWGVPVIQKNAYFIRFLRIHFLKKKKRITKNGLRNIIMRLILCQCRKCTFLNIDKSSVCVCVCIVRDKLTGAMYFAVRAAHLGMF